MSAAAASYARTGLCVRNAGWERRFRREDCSDGGRGVRAYLARHRGVRAWCCAGSVLLEGVFRSISLVRLWFGMTRAYEEQLSEWVTMLGTCVDCRVGCKRAVAW